MFSDKDAANTWRFGNSLFLFFLNAMKTKFYFRILLQYRGCIELLNYWPTHTNHKTEGATFG